MQSLRLVAAIVLGLIAAIFALVLILAIVGVITKHHHHFRPVAFIIGAAFFFLLAYVSAFLARVELRHRREAAQRAA
jgi:ABC-type nickel/cobalt efflux system permease component RcnA